MIKQKQKLNRELNRGSKSISLTSFQYHCANKGIWRRSSVREEIWFLRLYSLINHLTALVLTISQRVGYWLWAHALQSQCLPSDLQQSTLASGQDGVTKSGFTSFSETTRKWRTCVILDRLQDIRHQIREDRDSWWETQSDTWSCPCLLPGGFLGRRAGNEVGYPLHWEGKVESSEAAAGVHRVEY